MLQLCSGIRIVGRHVSPWIYISGETADDRRLDNRGERFHLLSLIYSNNATRTFISMIVSAVYVD